MYWTISDLSAYSDQDWLTEGKKLEEFKIPDNSTSDLGKIL
jgi:hypothetical protein